jgi:hypothetical protein
MRQPQAGDTLMVIMAAWQLIVFGALCSAVGFVAGYLLG